MGVLAVYFLDYTMGCGWWTMVLSLVLVLAVLLVRGKPYAADNISSILVHKPTCCSGTARENLSLREGQTDSTPLDKFNFT